MALKGEWLLVGLGNPGPAYRFTRHNMGFMVVEALAEEKDLPWRRYPLYEAAFWSREEGLVILLKPLTYMNLSGLAVREALKEHPTPLQRVVVIHDDLDLPFGRIRLRRDGGDGGHRGVRAVIDAVGPDFLRLKVGIDRPAQKEEVVQYVLSPFSEEESRKLPEVIKKASHALLTLIEEGPERAMNLFNRSGG